MTLGETVNAAFRDRGDESSEPPQADSTTAAAVTKAKETLNEDLITGLTVQFCCPECSVILLSRRRFSVVCAMNVQLMVSLR
jgi:hypothetical protein